MRFLLPVSLAFMKSERSPRLIARQTFLFVGPIVVATVLFLLLVGPTVWARSQINLFGLDLVQVWMEDPLSPSQDACSPYADAETVQLMLTRLRRVGHYDPRVILHQGAVACLQGDLPQAEALWATSAGKHPPDFMMSLFAAVAAFVDGRMLETPYVDEIGKYGYRQCAQSSREGDVHTAVSWCEFSFAYAPDKAAAGKLASLYDKLGEESSAQEVWHRLQDMVVSNSSDHWWALGQAAEQRKDWLTAANAYQQAAAMAGEKDVFRYYLRAGLMWLRAQDYAVAESVYQQALALNPDRVDAYLGLGDVYRSQKRHKGAVLWYEKALDVAPEHPSPSYQLGLVAWAQERYEDALAYFDQSLELRPDNAGVRYYKALTLDALQRRAEAMVVLDQAIAHHQNPLQSWLDLQERWRRYPDYAEAPERWWEKALAAEQEQNWPGAAGLYAEAASRAVGEDAYPYLLKEGAMRLRIREYEQAEATYRQALVLAPEKVDAYIGVGESFRYRKENESAEEWYREAMTLVPNNYRLHYHLGIVLYNQERYAEALEMQDRSLSMRPDNPWSLYYRSLTLNTLERRKEAIATLEQAIAAHKSPPESWAALLEQWRGE